MSQPNEAPVGHIVEQGGKCWCGELHAPYVEAPLSPEPPHDGMMHCNKCGARNVEYSHKCEKGPWVLGLRRLKSGFEDGRAGGTDERKYLAAEIIGYIRNNPNFQSGTLKDLIARYDAAGPGCSQEHIKPDNRLSTATEAPVGYVETPECSDCNQWWACPKHRTGVCRTLGEPCPTKSHWVGEMPTSEPIKPIGLTIIDHPKLAEWTERGQASQESDGLWLHYSAVCTLLKDVMR